MRKLYLKRIRTPNLGDTMNDNLMEYLIGKNNFTSVQHGYGRNHVFIAIGSILQWADGKATVWGAGFLTANSSLREQPKILAVRGPLSREKVLEIGFKCPEVYGDPALLYPRFYHPEVKGHGKIGIVTHYIDRPSPIFKKFIKENDVVDIHVQENVNKTVDAIRSCSKIISSSLHGIIIADAYGTPSKWIKITDKVLGNGFKFRDYFASVDSTDTEPILLSSIKSVEQIESIFSDYRKPNINVEYLLEVFYDYYNKNYKEVIK